MHPIHNNKATEEHGCACYGSHGLSTRLVKRVAAHASDGATYGDLESRYKRLTRKANSALTRAGRSGSKRLMRHARQYTAMAGEVDPRRFG